MYKHLIAGLHSDATCNISTGYYPGRYPRQHERPQVIGKQHLSLIYTAPPQKLISPSDNSYNHRYFSSIGLSELSVRAIICLDQKCGRIAQYKGAKRE